MAWESESQTTGGPVGTINVESNQPVNVQYKLVKGRLLPTRLVLQVIAALSLVLLPLSENRASGSDLISKIFGSNMNDVAMKIAELPEQYGEVIVRSLDFSPDGNRIAVESDGEKINIWDWRNRRVEKTIEKPRAGNAGNATNPLRYSPDGRFLAACEESGEGDVVVRIWNTVNWTIAKDIAAGTGTESLGACESIGFTPDGQQFIRTADTGGKPGNNLIVYAVSSWQPIWGLPLDAFFTPVSMAISPDGEMAAIAGTRTVIPWDVKDVNQRLQRIRHQPQIYIVSLRERNVVKVIQCIDRGPIAWSPDGLRLTVVGGPHVEIFDPRSGENLMRDKVEKSGSMNVRFTSDGRYFIDSDLNGMGKGLGVKIWDSQRHKLLQHIPGDIGSIDVSRDGKYLAVGATGRTTIWQIR